MTLVVALILSIYNESESLSFLVEGGICDQSSANRLQNLGSDCSITAPMAYTIEGIRFPADDSNLMMRWLISAALSRS